MFQPVQPAANQSSGPPRLTAAAMPSSSPKVKPMMIATPANSTEAGIAFQRISVTGSPVRESPNSSVSTSPSQIQYCS